MTTRSREEQFSGIKLWVTILERFYTGISLSRNATFSGKQAADFLYKILPSIVTHKECSREMAVNLLKLFLRDGYFLNNRNEDNRLFRDNDSTLYRFADEKIEEYIKDSGFGSMRVRRVSSMKVHGSHQRANNSVLRKCNNGCSDDADSFCSTRLSLSCGDLTQFSKPELELTKPSTSSYLVQSTKKNLKFLCESVLKSSDNVRNSSLVSRGMSPLIQRMSTRQSAKQQQTSDLSSSKSPTKKSGNHCALITKRCAITEADEFKLWTYCLTERFKQGAAGSSLIHEFNGADIRWNCKMTSARGIVARLPERIEKFEQNGEFSKSLIDDLRRLSNWSASTVVTSNNQKRSSADGTNDDGANEKVQNDSILSAQVLANSNGVKSDDRAGTQFELFKPPLETHLKTKSASPTTKPFVITPKKRGGQTEAGQLFSKIAITLVKCKFVPLVREDVAQSLVAIYDQMRRYGGGAKGEEPPYSIASNKKSSVLTNFSTNTTKPMTKSLEVGTRQAPVRLQKQTQGIDHSKNKSDVPIRTTTMEKLTVPAGPSQPTLSSSLQTRLQKRRSMNEPLLSEIAAENRQKFLSYVQLCLLTLEPPARRKLQVLLRYLDRILRNGEIRLHDDRDNRTYIVERLSALFIEPKGAISEVISANFLALFLNKLQELFFQIPPWLEADVRQKVENLVSGKEILTVTGSVVSTVCASRRSHEDVYGRRPRSHTVNTTSPPTALTKTYCERIDANTFESQKRQQDEAMLKLLDGIVGDENLKPAKRAEMLQSFRATYPRIYEIRFPTQNAAEISDVFLDDSVASTHVAKNPVARSQSLIERIRRMVID